jgi:hypothetical protein
MVCFYNSEKNDKFIEKMIFDYKKLAEFYKQDAPNLVCGCFDRATFDIPTISPKEQ